MQQEGVEEPQRCLRFTLNLWISSKSLAHSVTAPAALVLSEQQARRSDSELLVSSKKTSGGQQGRLQSKNLSRQLPGKLPATEEARVNYGRPAR